MKIEQYNSAGFNSKGSPFEVSSANVLRGYIHPSD